MNIQEVKEQKEILINTIKDAINVFNDTCYGIAIDDIVFELTKIVREDGTKVTLTQNISVKLDLAY